MQQDAESNVRFDQHEYIMKLEPMNKDDAFESFRSLRHKIAWISATRPDILAASNIYSQVTKKTFNPDNVKQMNKAIKYLKSTADQHLAYRHMDVDKCKLVVFADGSHASNMYQTSQIVYLVFLTDDTACHH